MQHVRNQAHGTVERRQGVFWIGTIPHADYTPYLPPGIVYTKGQLELGDGGYLHWQIVIAATPKISRPGLSRIYGPTAHWELTRSSAALAYVGKELTRVAGTQFELGECPITRRVRSDWDAIWNAARSGDILAIPASIRIQSYRTLRTIAADYMEPVAIERQVAVFWGPTGSGKSRRAWEDAGIQAYAKDPRTKFWCGYLGHRNVIIDEFRGGIDVSHMLRWLDRYPVSVETKGGATPLLAERIWITSNLPPECWYPGLDDGTLEALKRRMEVTEFTL